MSSTGYASYDPAKNQLEVIRPGENMTRTIRCTNLDPAAMKVHGVQVNGDEIWVLVGPHTNPRPNRKIVYHFSSLSGGASSAL
jgi:hypothetical protein